MGRRKPNKERSDVYNNFSFESMEGEVWKWIKDYEGLYEISNFGRVKSYLPYNMSMIYDGTPKKILRGKYDKDGYVEFKLCKDNKLKYVRGHRLVAQNFIENPENHPIINHIDAVKDNNHVSNLEWCNQSHNSRHMYDRGDGEYSKQRASETHGHKCKLISLEDGKEYIFNSVTQASYHLGMYGNYIHDKIRRTSSEGFEELIASFGYKFHKIIN